MSNLEMWSMIIGFISANFVLPIIQQPNWTTRVRAIVTFLYSILVSLGYVFFSGQLDLRNWVGSLLFVLVSAIATYYGFSRPTQLAPKLEEATSPKISS